MNALVDAAQFAADFAMIGQHAGTTARLRRFTSGSSGGAAWEGRGEVRTYVERPCTVMSVRPAKTEEVDASGGELLMGDLFCQVAGQVQRRDQVVLRGVPYLVQSEPQPEVLEGVRYQTCVLRRHGS